MRASGLEFCSDSLAMYSQRRKANSYSCKYFLCFQSIILSSFSHLQLNLSKIEGGGGSGGTEGSLHMLPAFLHHSLFLLSTPTTQEKLFSQRCLVTCNFQIERLLLISCLISLSKALWHCFLLGSPDILF